ncbi:HAMP domain-containing histidine kinase [Patescibacteria group bacterium]|nr:HAMP domain-containing histidine kinase [Patescibacteria group bacterium]
MIRRTVTLTVRGWQHLRQHSELWFVAVLAIALPLLILSSTVSVLKTATVTTTGTERSRVATIQSVVEEVLLNDETNTALLSRIITALPLEHSDIRTLTVVKEGVDGLVFHTAPDGTTGGLVVKSDELYRVSLTKPGESFIFEVESNGERRWRVYRAVETTENRYYIYSEHSRAAHDARFANHLWGTYVLLCFVVLFLLAFAYWSARQIDYKARWKHSQEALREHELFTSSIVHELRAPLTALRGYASMIEEAADVPQSYRTYADQIKRSAARLIALVSDYLEVTKLRSGTSTVSLAPTDIVSVIRDVVEELRSSASEKRLSLTIDAPEAMTLSSNEKLCTQIVTNLLSNAIKYTEAGSIFVSVTEEAQAVEVRIRDTGPGMSADDQKRLFAPFSRVGNTATSTITGSGLGMWITKLMVEQLGGTIGVESIKGVGTHVVVRFKKDRK